MNGGEAAGTGRCAGERHLAACHPNAASATSPLWSPCSPLHRLAAPSRPSLALATYRGEIEDREKRGVVRMTYGDHMGPTIFFILCAYYFSESNYHVTPRQCHMGRRPSQRSYIDITSAKTRNNTVEGACLH